MFFFWPRLLSQCGDLTPASIPSPTKGRSSPTNTPVFPPNSFILFSFMWFCIFFSSGQVLLLALSWCSPSSGVWRCIPDISIERHVLHVYLFLTIFFPIYKVLTHPPYSLDLSPTNYHFKNLNNSLQGIWFHNQQDAKSTFQEFIELQSIIFFFPLTGIKKHFLLVKMCWLEWFLL